MYLKFSEIKDLADARYAAAMMAEWMSFSIGKEDSLPVAKIQEIVGWCAGPRLVLEIENSVVVEKVKSYLNVLPVEGLELSYEKYKALLAEGVDCAFIILKDALFDPTLPEKFLFQHHAPLGGDRNITILDPAYADALEIKSKDIWAISVTCSQAEQEGWKDFSVWNDFFETLEII